MLASTGDDEPDLVVGQDLPTEAATPKVLTIISHVMEKLVARNEWLAKQTKGFGKSLEAFHGVRAPSISIGKYLERIYKYTKCSPSCFVVGYAYIDRLAHKHPGSLVLSLNVHRLLVTCVMIASKMLDDVHYNNEFYARVGGVSNADLNRMELELLFLLDFRVTDSRSVGAIAGLAIAVIFTWRALRTTGEPQRRQPKRRMHPPETSQSNVSSPHEDNAVQDVVDHFFQPVKPTLGQIVRQKLSEGRKVTCRLLGVILEESSPEQLQKEATVRSSVLEVLLEITKYSDLYLMERVVDDESEAKVLQALETAGVFTSGGLVKDKVLFCSTEMGRSSFVRQLEPDWHIDTNPEISTQLARFIKYQLHVSETKPERTAPNVFCSQSIEQFFGSA